MDDSKTPRKVLTAWPDDMALMGPNAPKNDGRIEHLIQYLLTVYERFGNTAITCDCDLQWGASALWKRDEQKERIEALERDLLACQERLRAAEEDARRDGMVWVPVEPTDKMIAAAMHCLDGVNLKTKGGTYGEQKYYKYIARYKAMLSAFPEKGKE
jgi:hypothetical protein